MRGELDPATVVSIHIAGEAQREMRSVPEVRAVAGRGLEGDRYFRRKGTFSGNPGAGREITLIEIEAIEALESEYDLKLDPGDARRNVVTRGVRLNDLVGREFNVGEVTLRGVRLCEPCAHLARLTDRRALPGLVHRGGLRADIVRGGVIRAGDPIRF